MEWRKLHPSGSVGLISPSPPDPDKDVIHLSFQEVEKMGEFHHQATQEMPPRGLLEKLQSAESIALKMLGRSRSRRLKFQQYQFRKTRYYALLAFFVGFLKEHGFQRIVFSKSPDRADLFILLKLAEELGLEIKVFHQLPFGGARLVSDSLDFPEPEPGSIPEALEKDLTREDLDQLRVLIKASATPASSPLALRVLNALARRKIKTITKLPDEFVYLPLDESSQSGAAPLAGSFTEPYLAILTLARALPSSTTLVIQER